MPPAADLEAGNLSFLEHLVSPAHVFAIYAADGLGSLEQIVGKGWLAGHNAPLRDLRKFATTSIKASGSRAKMTGEKGRSGRPPVAPTAGKKLTLSFRTDPDTKSKLTAAAEVGGRNLSEEMERRFDASFRDEDILGQAMTLAYGQPNAALLCLLGETLRTLAPRGEWLNDPASRDAVARGFLRLLRRLAAPEDGHVFRDGSSEAKVDRVLFDVGNDGSGHPGPLGYAHVWAAEVRRRLGSLGPLLVEMRRTVREVQETMPPTERPAPDPAKVDSWTKAFDRAAARATEKDKA
jgi:hypothetical protein